MTNTILILIVCSTVITSVVNSLKPAFKKFSGKYTVTVCTFLSFLLGVLASFSVAPYLWYELNTWVIILVGLALGTWSNLVYDVWDIIKSAWDKIRWTVSKE
jgi:predicted PurR-regulated permease PerM